MSPEQEWDLAQEASPLSELKVLNALSTCILAKRKCKVIPPKITNFGILSKTPCQGQIWQPHGRVKTTRVHYPGAASRQYGPSYSRKTLSKIDAECFFLMMTVTSCSILNVPQRPPVENELRFSRRRRCGGWITVRSYAAREESSLDGFQYQLGGFILNSESASVSASASTPQVVGMPRTSLSLGKTIVPALGSVSASDAPPP